ncbi:MAG: CorA family divalent cation transporter, partial [Gammaproteobacteria bacterium]
GSAALRNALSAIRRDTIMLRRYLAPQREAMIKLYSEKVDWLDDADKLRLREATDRLIRHIEDLDSIRERSSVTQEELINRMTEQMNARMYVLSLVAALFLPIGFFTGLLGVNVGGIPGAENNWGFGIFVIILVLIALIQILFFKRKGWF